MTIDVLNRFAKTGFSLLVCLVSVLSVSCDADSSVAVSDDRNDGYLQLEFSRDMTRADIGNDGSGSFSAGDVVGLYIDNGDNVEYRELTYDGSEWLPRLERSEFGFGELVLSAHYPAAGNSADAAPEAYTCRVDTDQSGDGFASSDLLFSKVSLGENDYRANFRFTHLMHRLRISITGEIDGIELSVRTIAGGSVNLLEGSVAVSMEKPVWITPRKISEGSYEALVVPQPVDPYREGDGLVRVKSTEKEVSFNAPESTSEGEPLTAFEHGKQTTMRLSIRVVDQDVANKTLWVRGVNAPAFPGEENIPSISPSYQGKYPEGEWFRADATVYESQCLTWKEGCGWYDCNKSVNYDENDKNLCWAASASNLLLWWLNNNKAYIEAYDEEYGSSVSSTVVEGLAFDRPSYEFLPLYYNGTLNRAPVFEFFKSNFPDRGSWNSAGVNWFIAGNTKNLLTPNIKGFPGFFFNVFDKTDIIAKDSPRQPNCETFNEFVIDALLNGKALGFNVFDIAGPSTGNHAMVFWGAEFDESGRVSHVYYCDNNMADQDANGAMMRRSQVVYIEENGYEYTYLKSLDNKDGNPVGKFMITSLCSVDLRRDIWKKKYPAVVAE
mgnify:FL=1